jgi:hypothetical protein
MASLEKSPTKGVSFSLFVGEAELSLPLSSSSPRINTSNSDLKLQEECNENGDEATSTDLLTFDFEMTKKGAGIPLVAGQTENETKARKMNKTEESRLETLRSHFEKQKTMFEKQYKQLERRFRVRSTRVLPNTPSNETRLRGNGVTRPKSLPAQLPSSMKNRPVKSKHSTGHNNCENDKPCATCVRIQKVIKQYEKEMKTNFDVENTHHTVCLFSDTQIKNFINLVETKFCSDLPGVAEMLHSSKSIEIQDGHHSDNNSNGKSVGIHDRIKAFCKSQEEFNKKHPVSRSVKTFVDNERITQARLATKLVNTKKP